MTPLVRAVNTYNYLNVISFLLSGSWSWNWYKCRIHGRQPCCWGWRRSSRPRSWRRMTLPKHIYPERCFLVIPGLYCHYVRYFISDSSLILLCLVLVLRFLKRFGQIGFVWYQRLHLFSVSHHFIYGNFSSLWSFYTG